MQPNQLSFAAGCVQEFPPEEQVRAAAAAGFSQCGVWVDPETWTDETTDAVLGVLKTRNIKVLDVEVIWIHPGEPDPQLEKIIRVGGALGAKFGLVVSSDPDLQTTAQRFTQLCRVAAEVGLTLVFEFLPITEVKSLASAVEIVQRSGASNAGALIDSLHLSRTGSTPSDLDAYPKNLFPYLQICDAPSAPADYEFNTLLDEAVDGRLMPGAGALPVAELVQRFADVPLSLEIRSRELRDSYPQIDARARAVFDAGCSFLQHMVENAAGEP